jgi:hypothetical protein
MDGHTSQPDDERPMTHAEKIAFWRAVRDGRRVA